MWWSTVQIGSLVFPPWSSVYEAVSFGEVQSIFLTNPFKYLLVVDSRNLEYVKGVICRKDVDAMSQTSEADGVMNAGDLPISKIAGLISTNFEWLQISGGVIGDIEEVLKRGCSCVILYRTSQLLTMTVEKNPITNNNTERSEYLEKRHPVAVVNESDLRSWINKVEGHHNID